MWIDHYSGAYWPMLWMMMMVMVSVIIPAATTFFIIMRRFETRLHDRDAFKAAVWSGQN